MGKYTLKPGVYAGLNTAFVQKWGDEITTPWGRKVLEMEFPDKKREIGRAYRDFNNDLRTAYNFKAQSLANSIISRAAVDFLRWRDYNNTQCAIIMQVHDELVLESWDESIEEE